ncbi:serine/threonine-protein kinase [Reticulomyxa filosa]|uniref:Serine/threonine-protein kinase n=1 Tax=Reticulomyxa filosa TaxID=46433 RepID=X6NSW2_RETFI|nr:serine/threonine-protein kinase [Reticulomyxa filosa]|eukprot:ETO29101.1 serine/threonine-protein kinase [Reticulomyxa filosa]
MSKRKFREYEFLKCLMNTSQGEIWLSKNTVTNEMVTIKTALKPCVLKGISTSNGKVHEDFKNECNVVNTLTDRVKEDIKSGKMTASEKVGFITSKGCMEDDDCYYLVMDYYSDSELFGLFSSRFPMRMKSGQAERKRCIQHVFQQLLVDFSLATVIVDKTIKLKGAFFLFVFNIEGCILQWKIGRLSYVSPECYENKEYDAFANDIWCLGVVLFGLFFGRLPSIRDRPTLQRIVNGDLELILQKSNCLHLINEHGLDCLNRLLRLEHDRITMDELLNHPFVTGGNQEAIIIKGLTQSRGPVDHSGIPLNLNGDAKVNPLSTERGQLLLTPKEGKTMPQVPCRAEKEQMNFCNRKSDDDPSTVKDDVSTNPSD